MGKTKITALKPLAETRFLSLYEASYTNKSGAEKKWMVASRKSFDTLNSIYFNSGTENSDAVVILAYHIELKKIVIIKQFRIPLNDYVIELPAGLKEANEAMETSVERELKEETGLELVAINYDKSKKKLYLSPGMTDESVDLVYCTCKGEVTLEHLEEDEEIEVLLLSQREALELLKSNIKFDIKVHGIIEIFAEIGEALFK